MLNLKKKTDDELRYLTIFIDIICAIIVTRAFGIFVDNFQILKFSYSTNDISRTILFISACTVLIYDWIAYHRLIEKLPYRNDIYSHRFFLDIIIFFLMYLLFIVVLDNSFLYLALIIIWFFIVGIWHTIAWYEFKNDPNLKDIPKRGMIANYRRCGFCLILYFVLQYFRELIHEDVIGIILGSIIIIFCIVRIRTVLKMT